MHHTCTSYRHRLKALSCVVLVHRMSGATSGKGNDQDDWSRLELLEETRNCWMLVASRHLLLKPHFEESKSQMATGSSSKYHSPVYDPYAIYKSQMATGSSPKYHHLQSMIHMLYIKVRWPQDPHLNTTISSL